MRRLDGYGVFFRLLKAALAGETCSVVLTEEEWRDVYDTACRQSVQGVMFPVIEALPKGSGIPSGLAGRWALDARRIEGDYRRHLAVVEKQRSTWAARGVDAVLLKGTASAALYPRPELRVCGDIDWWMRTDADWSKALKVLENNGIAYGYDSDGDISYSLAGVVVEHHRKGLISDSNGVVLYLLNEHIMHHAMVFGVGLRQLCDYALALKRYDAQENMEEYRMLVRENGLEAWTTVLDELAAFLMAPWDAAIPSGKAGSLLSLMMTDGNMGLDKEFRLSGLLRRATLFLSLAPGSFAKRWLGLVFGRLKRN